MKKIVKKLLFVILVLSISALTLSSCDDILGLFGEYVCEHQWSEWEVVEDGDCQTQGLKQRECEICGTTEEEATAKIDHVESYWIYNKEATCTEDGERHTECKVCGRVVSTEKIPAYSDHIYRNYNCIFCGLTSEECFEFIHIIESDSYCIRRPKPGIKLPDKISLPSTYKGKKVTRIGDSAFRKCADMISLVIPDSVTSIGDSAFYYCTSLTSVVIGDSVTAIGSNAFYGCSSLTGVVIPDSVTYIDFNAFAKCYNLTDVVISNNVTYIGREAFWYCSSLTEIVIPDSVTSIGDSAFAYCTSLQNVVIGKSVTSIGDFAFCECENLVSANLPDGVTYIGRGAFYKNHKLTGLVIPDGVTYIGGYAFAGCRSITSVVIPDGITSISEYAFSVCSSMISLVIPNSVTSIGDFAFSDFSSMTSLVIPDSVTYIGGYAFAGWSSIENIVIPDAVTAILQNTFSECSSLKNVVVGKSVANIDARAFSDCESLIGINVSEGNQYYQSIEGNLYSKDGKTLVKYAIGKKDIHFEVPNGVITIGDDAFFGCSSLESVVISDSVTDIKSDAFYGLGIKELVVGSGVTHIYAYAFQACGQLTSNGYIINNIYYKGTIDEWHKITIDYPESITLTHIHPYSENHPTDSPSSYWHWVDGKPAFWEVHIVVDKAVAPTCSSTGLTEGSHCSACGTVIKAQEVIEKVEHNYVNGKCEFCGATSEE